MQEINSVSDIKAQDVKSFGIRYRDTTFLYEGQTKSPIPELLIIFEAKEYVVKSVKDAEERRFKTVTDVREYINSIVIPFALNEGSHYNLRSSTTFGYAVTMYRKSGNVHSAYHCITRESALNEINKTLNKAVHSKIFGKILPQVYRNTCDKLHIIVPNAGRKQGGKNVTDFEIVALDKPYDDWVAEKQEKNNMLNGVVILVVIVFAVLAFLLKQSN